MQCVGRTSAFSKETQTQTGVPFINTKKETFPQANSIATTSNANHNIGGTLAIITQDALRCATFLPTLSTPSEVRAKMILSPVWDIARQVTWQRGGNVGAPPPTLLPPGRPSLPDLPDSGAPPPTVHHGHSPPVGADGQGGGRRRVSHGAAGGWPGGGVGGGVRTATPPWAQPAVAALPARGGAGRPSPAVRK